MFLFATAPTLPPTGVEVGSWLEASEMALGQIVVVAVGCWFAFHVVKRGLMWVQLSLGRDVGGGITWDRPSDGQKMRFASQADKEQYIHEYEEFFGENSSDLEF